MDAKQEVKNLCEMVVKADGSDLHLTVGRPPTMRLNGELISLRPKSLQPVDTAALIYSMLSAHQKKNFEEFGELDFAHAAAGARFRVNVYKQRGALGAAMRLIPAVVRSLDDLGLPAVMSEFADLPRGLVLVCGPTGHGKSTTLAALVDRVNSTRSVHIMTVEDPIEYTHTHKLSMINQREVGSDTKSFTEALKRVLRQDPDVILIGELRDLESISMGVTAAETGHLVFATLHTQDAPQTIDRIIDVFPPHQQAQVRMQLAGSLAAVVCQQLLPTADGDSRVVASEILVVTPGVRNMIREGKTHLISSSIQAGGALGMQTMDAALAKLVRAKKISRATAREACHDPKEFERLAGGRLVG